MSDRGPRHNGETFLPRARPTDETNTEPINFRVPKKLKQEMELVREFEMISSSGELMRTLLRVHVTEVTEKPKYQDWLTRRTAEKAEKAQKK